MIRSALALFLLTILSFQHLPKLRAKVTEPFYQQCLKIAPSTQTKNEIQSLVCGRSLPNSSMTQSWKNLGLIHILVVSGGHLSILASLLLHIFESRWARRFFSKRSAWNTAALILIFFSFANRLQPPVLRSLIEWLCRSRLERRGWRRPEISLFTTWIALPFCANVFDLLSLALSFFASIVVETTSRSLYRHQMISGVGLQIAVWWILAPLLFTFGLPHPLTTMTNLVIAPLLGATLIPLAMLTWLSGILPALSGNPSDPVWLGSVFDLVWTSLSAAVRHLADALPAPTPRLGHAQPLISDLGSSLVMVVSVFCATCALLVRSHRNPRSKSIKASPLRPLIVILIGVVASIVLHQGLTALV